ncbi:MAG: YHS domain-containing (seleno)protein [Hasllibacter sp.]
MPTRRRILAAVPALLAAPLILRPRPAIAMSPETYAEGGVAIDGSDAVAYFAGNGPVPGTAEHAVAWKGAEWRFADAASRAAFEADPDAYAPRYGGYCAYAASLGYVAPTVPEAWTLWQGRLYLNANLRARELWLQDVPGNVAKGDANWPGILG